MIRIANGEDRNSEPAIVRVTLSELREGQTAEFFANELPAELREPRPVGEPFSHDDLIAFHELLDSDGWLQRLCDNRGS